MSHRGFTLIETMVAVTILTFAVSGPLFIANRSIIAAQTARDQLTALYLAQEGIEYVRMMRDNTYLAAYRTGGENVSSEAWENFLDNEASDPSTIKKCRAPKVCTLDPTQASSPLVRCPNERCDPLSLAASNIYTQESHADTRSPFTRTIQAVTVSPHEEKIVSTVSWTFHGIPYSVTMSDHLTPWQ